MNQEKYKLLVPVLVFLLSLSVTFATYSIFATAEGGGIQKMSICYSGRIYKSDVKSYIAQHFDLVDTEISSGASSHVQWIKDNAVSPDFKAIGYYESIFSDESASNWGEINPHEDWFIHSATTANRVERDSSTGYLGQYLMNPNSGWSDYMATRCQNALTSYPMYDGVFMDDYAGDLESTAYGPYYFMDANTHVSFSLPYQGKFDEGYTRTNWGTWMTAYTTNLRNTLGSDMIMTNNHIDTYLGNIAGAMLWEGFVHSRSSSYSSNGYYPSNIILAVDKLHEQALQEKIIATNSGCSGGSASQKEEWAKFVYVCLSFAVEDPAKAYFSWEFMPSDPTTLPTWYSFMDTELGFPEDDYHKIADPYVYERTFSNYYAIANLDNLGNFKTFTFNGVNYNLEGKHALLIEKSPSSTTTTQQTTSTQYTTTTVHTTTSQSTTTTIHTTTSLKTTSTATTTIKTTTTTSGGGGGGGGGVVSEKKEDPFEELFKALASLFTQTTQKPTTTIYSSKKSYNPLDEFYNSVVNFFKGIRLK